MAGHYRVLTASAQIGQPEVKLGIIPGAGHQRLPRLVGVDKAVEMCAFGQPVKAAEAHALGIADAIIEEIFWLAQSPSRARRPPGLTKARERDERLSGAEAEIFDQARRRQKKTARANRAAARCHRGGRSRHTASV